MLHRWRALGALLVIGMLVPSLGSATSDPTRCSNPPCPPFDRLPPTDPACRDAYDTWIRSMPGAEHPDLMSFWLRDYPRCWLREPASPSGAPRPSPAS